MEDGFGREVLRGRRTYCTTQLDFQDLPPTHRLIPMFDLTNNVSVHAPGPRQHVNRPCSGFIAGCYATD